MKSDDLNEPRRPTGKLKFIPKAVSRRVVQAEEHREVRREERRPPNRRFQSERPFKPVQRESTVTFTGSVPKSYSGNGNESYQRMPTPAPTNQSIKPQAITQKPKPEWPHIIKHPMEPLEFPICREPLLYFDDNEKREMLFQDEHGRVILPSDTLFFVQLPSKLPIHQTKKVNGEENAEEDGFENMKEGYIGKIRVRKNGEMTLALGDKSFHVETAEHPTFVEEVASIDHTNKTLTRLGAITKHLIVTPDFDALLSAP